MKLLELSRTGSSREVYAAFTDWVIRAAGLGTSKWILALTPMQ
jgi:hypothetical protein